MTGRTGQFVLRAIFCCQFRVSATLAPSPTMTKLRFSSRVSSERRCTARWLPACTPATLALLDIRVAGTAEYPWSLHGPVSHPTRCSIPGHLVSVGQLTQYEQVRTLDTSVSCLLLHANSDSNYLWLREVKFTRAAMGRSELSRFLLHVHSTHADGLTVRVRVAFLPALSQHVGEKPLRCHTCTRPPTVGASLVGEIISHVEEQISTQNDT